MKKLNIRPTGVQFASCILQNAENRKLSPNLTKIQKWTYICYGLHLAVFQAESFLFEEKPYCWPHGPFSLKSFIYKKIIQLSLLSNI